MTEKDEKFVLDETPGGFRRSPTEKSPTQKVRLGESISEVKPARPRENSAARPSDAKGEPVRRAKKPASAPRDRKPSVSPFGKRRPSVPTVDPMSLSQREKNRLHAEERRRQKRTKQIRNYVLLGLVGVALLILASLTILFGTKTVAVLGESPYTDEEIIKASGIKQGDNVIRLSSSKVNSKIVDKLPYIKSARLNKNLSGKVQIVVTQTKGAYAFIDGERCVVTAEDGKVLSIEAAETASQYTILQGVTIESLASCVPGKYVSVTEKDDLELARIIYNAASDAEIDSITSIDITNPDYIKLIVEERLSILAGGKEDIGRKLALAAKVIERENELSPTQFGIIDLTIDGKAFFRPATEADIELPLAPVGELSGEEESTSEEEVSEEYYGGDQSYGYETTAAYGAAGY